MRARLPWPAPGRALGPSFAVCLGVSLGSCAAPIGVRAPENSAPPTTRVVVEPYVWLVSLSGEVPGSDGPGGGSSPIDVDLLGVEDLRSAAMLSVEAGSADGSVTLLTDFIHAAFDNESDLLGIEVGGEMAEALGSFAPPSWGGAEFLVGPRYWRLFSEVALGTVAAGRAQETWLDPVVGLRGGVELAPDLELRGRADLAGFGLGSDWTYQLRADLLWRLSDGFALRLGYRYLRVEFDDFDLQAELAGPALGLRWTF